MVDRDGYLGDLRPDLDDSSSPCLRFIDWYDYTIFNNLQIEHQFLPEWRSLYDRAKTQEVKEFLGQIEALAQRCLEERLYLSFVGD